jgi:hypothetical protein
MRPKGKGSLVRRTSDAVFGQTSDVATRWRAPAGAEVARLVRFGLTGLAGFTADFGTLVLCHGAFRSRAADLAAHGLHDRRVRALRVDALLGLPGQVHGLGGRSGLPIPAPGGSQHRGDRHRRASACVCRPGLPHRQGVDGGGALCRQLPLDVEICDARRTSSATSPGSLNFAPARATVSRYRR